MRKILFKQNKDFCVFSTENSKCLANLTLTNPKNPSPGLTLTNSKLTLPNPTLSLNQPQITFRSCDAYTNIQRKPIISENRESEWALKDKFTY